MKKFDLVRNMSGKLNRISLIAPFLLLLFSSSSSAYECKDMTGNTFAGGTRDIYVNISPLLRDNENLAVDLSQSIYCRNTVPRSYIDWVSLDSGTTYGGALSNFKGSLSYYGDKYALPTTSRTKDADFRTGDFMPWDVQLYLTPTSAASGVLINKGELIAIISMYKYSTNPNTGAVNGSISRFTWRVIANNTAIIPTGGCDVSSRNVTINLPDYPGSAAVPLTVSCSSTQKLAYYLTGSTNNTNNTTFSNVSNSNPASGIGVQLSNSNGIISTNKNVSLGNVGTTPVSLGLTASYGRTSGQISAGMVQSVIGVTFVYE